MERNMMQELIAWKNMQKNRMPLLLYGVRQVGKAYIFQELLYWVERYLYIDGMPAAVNQYMENDDCLLFFM